MPAISTLSMQHCTCPKCGAKPGEYCRSPSGRKYDGTGGTHAIRWSQLSQQQIDSTKVQKQ